MVQLSWFLCFWCKFCFCGVQLLHWFRVCTASFHASSVAEFCICLSWQTKGSTSLIFFPDELWILFGEKQHRKNKSFRTAFPSLTPRLFAIPFSFTISSENKQSFHDPDRTIASFTFWLLKRRRLNEFGMSGILSWSRPLAVPALHSIPLVPPCHLQSRRVDALDIQISLIQEISTELCC